VIHAPRRRAGAARATDAPTAPSLPRRLRRWLAGELTALAPVVTASAAQCAADRYRKHFHSYAHTCLLVFHGLRPGHSLRQSYTAFAATPGLAALSGLAVPGTDRLRVSFSQVTASHTSRPAAWLAGVVAHLLPRVQAGGRLRTVPTTLDLHAIDSTFVKVSARLAAWLPTPTRTEQAGVRIQVQLTPALDLPRVLCITDTHTNDVQGLDRGLLTQPERLATLRDHTLVFDLGYYSHARFAQLRAAGVHVITRLHPQARVQVDATTPVQPPLPGLPGGRITLHTDQRVTVGAAANAKGAVLPGLRLVTATVAPLPAAARRGATAVTYRLLTDRFDLTAAEVVQGYLWRWQIELFFRWLKAHVHLPRLLGYSENAVELTVWLALVVHLLTLLAAVALGFTRRCPILLSLLPTALALLTAHDAIVAINAHPCQLAFPGWLPKPHPPPTR
jgi:hypothetical protein